MGRIQRYPEEATGKSTSIRGMQISRFENGTMVERWGTSGQIGIIQQISGGESYRLNMKSRADDCFGGPPLVC